MQDKFNTEVPSDIFTKAKKRKPLSFNNLGDFENYVETIMEDGGFIPGIILVSRTSFIRLRQAARAFQRITPTSDNNKTFLWMELKITWDVNHEDFQTYRGS